MFGWLKQNKNKKLAGLTLHGNLLTGQELEQSKKLIVAVAEKKKAFGAKIKTNICAYMCGFFEGRPGPEKIDIVIGDPYLLENIAIVARGRLRDLQVPEAVQVILSSVGMHNHHEFIVLKTKNNGLIWVQAFYLTTRENFERKLGRKLTADDLVT